LCIHRPARSLPLLHTSPHTCTRHLNTHIPGATSSSSPIMCKLYYFYPKYISPPCAARRSLRGQQVKLHMSVVSHPTGTVSLSPYPPPGTPHGSLSSLLSESHVHSHLAQRRSSRIGQKVGFGNHDYSLSRMNTREREGESESERGTEVWER